MGLLKNVQLARSESISDGQNLDNGNKNTSGSMLLDKDNGQNSSFVRKDRREKSSPLKLIIMSASLDARAFSEYFGGAKAVHIQGRQFPVDIFYTCKPETDYVDAALITIFQVICLISTYNNLIVWFNLFYFKRSIDPNASCYWDSGSIYAFTVYSFMSHAYLIFSFMFAHWISHSAYCCLHTHTHNNITLR
jgi:hypothetical protein